MIGTLVEPKLFHSTVKKMREFFDDKGFTEVHPQTRQSILAACEDPSTIRKFNFGGETWPKKQTNQMDLEMILLENPDLDGLYCLTTSYRDEPNPTPGRHDKIFPMFEFEMRGDMEDMIELEKELLEHLGFPMKGSGDYPRGRYEDMADEYGVDILTEEHENQIGEDYGPAFFLTDFPERTSPFWNMRRREDEKGIAKKVDVLLYGMETIGSAERAVDPDKQREAFYEISDGKYAETLFDEFSEERVEQELEDFLSYDFFKRSGGGIGMTRLIQALEKLKNE